VGSGVTQAIPRWTTTSPRPTRSRRSSAVAGTAPATGEWARVEGTGTVRGRELDAEQPRPLAAAGVVDRSEELSIVLHAAVRALSKDLASEGIGEQESESLLVAVARLHSWPSEPGREIEAFAALARVFGRRRLIEALDEAGEPRLGAIRLLLAR
jgi:hypothetical protein